MSSGSLKELSKAIQAYIPLSTLPVPEDLNRIIEAYLQKHEKVDESSSERLHDELLSIYHKNVKDYPSRYAGFIAVLSPLVAVIRSPARILSWWDLMRDNVVGSFPTEKGLMAECFAALLNLLSVDEILNEDRSSDGASNPFVDRLISGWMDKYHVDLDEGNKENAEKAVRESLVFYGKRKPKDFLTILDKYFVKKEYRVKTATLLCEFIENKPPHLYQVLQTPLFGNLLRCLQLDTSTTVVSMALTVLIMLLPHMPSSLVPHLPTLFNIYARLLFWHRERSNSADIPGEELPQRTMINPAGWESCDFVADADGHHIPHLRNYFTVLYGLYPINFMDYIRKPQRYLRHANAPNADDVEVQPTEIRHQSEQFRRGHLLHPNFYSLTIESEKTDHGRWQTSEPAEVVAECMALCTISDTGPREPADPPRMPGASSTFTADESEQDGDHALLSGSAVVNRSSENWRLTQSTTTDSVSSSRGHSVVQRQSSQSSHPSNRDSGDARSRGAGGDSPTLPPHFVLSTSHSQLQDLVSSNKGTKSGLHQSLANDSVPSLALSHQDSIPDRPPSFATGPSHQRAVSSPISTMDVSSQLLQLRQQVLLLQNDLSFERYLKQQHMAHIGELRRRQVKEAASEAETQNLIMANRNLKNRFEEAKKAEMRIRKESEKSRSLAKKWEADLSAKLKNLREESKKTKAEGEALRRDLDMARDECEKLKKRVCEAEVRDLSWKQHVQSQEMDMTEMDRLKAEVERLTIWKRDFQAREAEMKAALASAEDAESQLETLAMQLDARERELQQARKLYETQIVVLKSKLLESQDGKAGRHSASMAAVMESALAASRAKQSELQKQYSLLMRKYTVLQSSLLDMKADPGSSRQRMESSSWSDDEGDGPVMPRSNSPAHIRNRPQRVFSNPEVFEATSSFNATPPLDTRPGPSTMGSAGPSTPTGVSLSPEQQLYHGRGGVQNRIRKDGKDKRPPEGDKKDKKSTGLRGITRNFV